MGTKVLIQTIVIKLRNFFMLGLFNEDGKPIDEWMKASSYTYLAIRGKISKIIVPLA